MIKKSRLAIPLLLALTFSFVALPSSHAATSVAKAAPTPTPNPAPIAPTNVGAYFKVEIGYMVSWTLPANLVGVTGYTVTASNGAKCNVNGSINNQCIYSGSTVPNPFSPFVPYTFTVVTNSTVGSSAPSAPSNAATWYGAPGYPAPLLTKAISNTQIDAEWVPSPSTGGLPIYGYRLTYWEVTLNSMGDPNNATQVDLLTTKTSASITGLKPSTWYVFNVAACNALGCSSSDWSYIATTPKVGAALTWKPPTMISGGSPSTTCWDAVYDGGTAATTGSYTKSTVKCGNVTIDPSKYPVVDPTATQEALPNIVNKFTQNIYIGGWQAKYSLATWSKIGLPWVPYLSLSSKSYLRGFLIQPSVVSNSPSVCTVTGKTINLLSVGTCSITVSAPGDLAADSANDQHFPNRSLGDL
jgi:Fibronectin type III domain